MLHSKAAKMEAALLGGLIKAIVPKLISLGQEKYKLHASEKRDIEFLIRELRLISATIEASEQGDGHGALSSLWIEDLRELAFGIEDFLDGRTYHAIWKKQPSSFRKLVGLPKMLRNRLQFAGERKKLRNKSTEIYEQLKRYRDLAGAGPGPGPQSSAAPMDESPSQAFHPRNILHTDLVGVDGLRAELLEQLAEDRGRLKVISIVGFCGLGKTAVAAQVYNSQTGDRRFEKHAWVCAAGKRPTKVLADVLSELTADAGCSQGTSTKDQQLCEDIRKQLHNKRYLIVIDDIQEPDMWRNIKSAFPDDNGVSSRILVTTTIHLVANACSSTESYVHKMRRLDKGCSKQLFSSKACPNNKYSCYEHKDSEAILKKCGGQPLALVTIGEFLQMKGWPTGSSCKDICNKLHYHLKMDKTFEEMRGVLIRNYTSLTHHAMKACLLYFGMFPIDYEIKRKSLFRLWLAEGFVVHASKNTPDAMIAFDELKDRNIIESIYASNNESMKTFQIYSMMHEVIMHMPFSKNFVTLLCDDMKETKYVRRLSLHKNDGTDESNLDIEALSLVRSLMVFGKAGEAFLDFNKYRLLRVLDLEKCDYVDDNHVKNICSLLLLKYLSLGKNVTKLPKDISKLTVLETLDLRGSMVAKLRAEVFQMPGLVHLFGKFKIACALDFSSQGRSELQTLAGFIAHGEQGYLNLMDYMIKLRKVKVWCESTADAGDTNCNWTDLQKAIQKFMQDKNEANNGDRSLSLHFDKSFKDYLYSLKEPCYLSSLKLYGELDALPQFVISLSGLKELCLSYVKFTTDLLEALILLSNLEYLKLIADDLEKFTIKKGAFPKLVHLCFVLKYPTFPTIEKGSMEPLKTLQLLCKDLHGLCGITIEYLENLQEVILDDRVHPDTWGQWKEAAKKHTKKPKVFPFKTTESSKRESDAEISKGKTTEDTDTSMPVNEGSESCAEQKTHNSCAFQASSDDRYNSSFSHMGVLEVSPLTKLSDPTTVYSANNSISTDETIAHDTQIPINENLGSSDEPKRQNRSPDMHTHAFKSTGVSEDSVSTELSITGYGMAPS